MSSETVLYQLQETSKYMMGFVIVTKENNAIVIDGGRAEDMPLLKEYIGGRHIAAWILTHPHVDHVGGLLSELERDGGADFDIEKIYHHFPDFASLWAVREKAPWPSYFEEEITEVLPLFERLAPALEGKLHRVEQGAHFAVDECGFDVLYTYHQGLNSNPMNDASLVFRLETPGQSVLFLGDLGPEGGDVLYEEARHLLQADIVQMAHHGHMIVGREVYAAVAPKVCLWCCPEWLYNEPEIPPYLADRAKARARGRTRMYGTAVTRRWMDALGVKTHYVTKDGTHRIVL